MTVANAARTDTTRAARGRARPLLVLGATLIVTLAAPSRAQAQRWRRVLDGEGYAAALAIHDGDVVAAGDVGRPMTAVKLRAATGDVVWRSDIFEGHWDAVAIDSAGAAILSGAAIHGSPSFDFDFTVAKLASDDGHAIWRLQIDGSAHQYDEANAVAVDSAGDVVAVGTSSDARRMFAVAKFSGLDGTELWRYAIPGDGATAVAVDRHGDVVVAGQTTPASFSRANTVVKLAGATGQEVWRYDETTIDFAAAGVAVDGADDVIGALSTGVVKRAGDTGAELWRVGQGAGPATMRVDSAGNVVVGGMVKLDGATGAELWRSPDDGRVAIDSADDIIIVGRDLISGTDLVKRNGATGAVVWRHHTPGYAGLAVDGSGDVLGAGGIAPLGVFSFVVDEFDGTNGNDYLVSGKRLRVTDAAGAPARRSLNFMSKDLFVLLAPVPVDDPTVSGADLELVNPATGETASMALPAAGWRPLGSPPASSGYRYDDPHGALGPCTRFLLGPRKMQARCKGAGIGFSLDEPAQGSLAVRLTMGGGLRRCALFGGTVRADRAAVGSTGGLFFAKDAAEPAGCP